MAFKFVLFAACVAVARAGVLAPAPLGYAAPAIARVATPLIAQGPVLAKTVAVDADFDPNPQYSYAYDIQDALTGDNKNHVESRSGDVVQGSYSLVDPDGVRRTVEYTADPVNGFNAVVHREPLVKQVVAKVAPVAYAAPVAKIAAPIAYAAPKFAAPIAPVAYAAPRFAAPIAQVGYAAPRFAAPIAQVGYAAPIGAPLGYAAPRFAAPLGAPLGYAAPYGKTIIH